MNYRVGIRHRVVAEHLHYIDRTDVDFVIEDADSTSIRR
jgi:hypothetical protein